MRGLGRLGGFISCAALMVAGVLPSLPALADETPQWETISDTGALGDDIGRFTAASPTLNMVNQGLDTVFVSGTTGKPSAVASTGVNDLDVGTTAYNAETGAVRWRSTYDRGVGIDDQLGAFEINYHNNLIYEMVNSGADIVTIERGVSDGKVSRSATYAGATARDSAISSVGGFLGVVGSKGPNFLALAYQTGSQTLELNATPVAGKANSADISHTGSLDNTRTLLATGQSSGFGTGGDMYTVAYNYRTGAKLWERSWASENNRADEGSVAEAAHVGALGKGVGFVAGRTFSPERGWDINVTAFDLATGNQIWNGPATFNGAASDDDTATHLVYSDKTSTLYLTGTSERGTPHGQDVVTIAYDAVTGRQKAVAYASGDSANADDSPTGLTVSNDGRRVLLAADVQNLIGTGSRQAAVFAYDSGLRGAGTRVVGGSGDDRSAGVALNVAQNRVFLAGSTRTNTGYDHRAASFSLDGFALPKIPTDLVFTAESAVAGQFTDSATLEVKLTDDTDTPLGNRPVTLSLAGQDISTTTSSSGRATATFSLDEAPGTYTATASFSPDDSYLGSTVSRDFEITPEDASLEFDAASATGGQYTDHTTLAATLTDDAGNALQGREVTISLGGRDVATTTGADGAARADFILDSSPGSYEATASFGGDSFYLPAAASSPFAIDKEDTLTTLTVSGKGKKRTATARLFDADSPTSGVAGRQVVFFADGSEIGRATTAADGVASISNLPSRYRDKSHRFNAQFAGDAFFLPSSGEFTTPR